MLVHKNKFIFSFYSGAISNMCRGLSYSVSLADGGCANEISNCFLAKANELHAVLDVLCWRPRHIDLFHLRMLPNLLDVLGPDTFLVLLVSARKDQSRVGVQRLRIASFLLIDVCIYG